MCTRYHYQGTLPVLSSFILVWYNMVMAEYMQLLHVLETNTSLTRVGFVVLSLVSLMRVALQVSSPGSLVVLERFVAVVAVVTFTHSSPVPRIARDVFIRQMTLTEPLPRRGMPVRPAS